MEQPDTDDRFCRQCGGDIPPPDTVRPGPQLVSDLAAMTGRTGVRRFNRAAVRKALRNFLDDWSALLAGNLAEARPVLSIVLAGDRIAFTPMSDGRYKLTVPIAYDRMIATVIPELGALQDMGTSPAGTSPFHLAGTARGTG